MFSAIDAYTAGFFADGEVAFRCEKKPADVVRTLDEHLESWPVFNVGRDVLVGYVRSNRLVVSRRRPMMQNAFRPVFRATIEPAGEGSRIRGRYTLMRPVMVFMAVWFGFLGMIAMGLGLGVVTAGGGSNASWILAIVAMMAVFGTTLVFGGMAIGRSDTEEIECRLKRLLDAED